MATAQSRWRAWPNWRSSMACPWPNCSRIAGRRGSEARGRLVIDLVRLKSVDDPEAAPLARFAASIQAQRGDYNGKVLTIRSEDLRALAVIYDQAPGELAERMVGWGVLAPEVLRGEG